METLGEPLKRNPLDWKALRNSATILEFALDHLQAAKSGNLKQIHVDFRSRARAMLELVMIDWNINRYPRDPNLKGTYVPGQNLAWRFRQLSEK